MFRIHAKAPINPSESASGTIAQSETDRAIAAWRVKRAGTSAPAAVLSVGGGQTGGASTSSLM